MVKPFYNEMVKNDKSDFKKPLEMTTAEYNSVTSKLNWNARVKYSLFSINSDPLHPIRLCHLLLLTAYKLKVFGEDAYGKVTSRCKVAATIINYLLEKNRVFFPVNSGRQRVPTRVRLINDETFKSAVVDLVKCSSDTTLQRHYVGDGHGDVAVAGLGLPPSALTDGASPSAKTLFRRCLHEVKGLLESKAYLSNPNSASAAASHAQASVLEGINNVLNGEASLSSAAASRADEDILLEANINARSSNDNNTNNNYRLSPLSCINSTGTGDEKKKSPASMMAEASLLSQQAAVADANNLEKMISLQAEELKMRQEEVATVREERKEELRLLSLERERSNDMLKKKIEKLYPETDPTDKFMARKRKLDEGREVLGEELYNAKLQQLKDECMNVSAL